MIETPVTEPTTPPTIPDIAPSEPGDEPTAPDTTTQPTPSTPSSGTSSGGVSGTFSAPEVTAAVPSIEADKDIAPVPLSERKCIEGSLLKLPTDNSSATQADSVVYYCAADGMRYVFPNEDAYFSWYSDFTGIQEVSTEQLSQIPLGESITYRPGKMLVKVVSDPKVYAVAKGGVLRWLVDEMVASTLYGALWRKLVLDIPTEFFLKFYQIGDPITSMETEE